tara:strand:+ start:168 stop:401 length:234 start_codon:yes stop_codon:yes gene_type:complete
MWQPSGHTPLWIPYISFETKEECLSHVMVNQVGLFAKAIEQYNGQIPPQQISCVPEKGLQELIKPIDQQIEEDKSSV